jgi:predicted cupin superfamily sugar epimerase
MKDADSWIEKLMLSRHPEGGYYREVYRSEESISVDSLPGRYRGDRAFSTAIYYLLKGDEFSAFHRLRSDEIWHFYTGSPVLIHLIMPSGEYRRAILGIDEEGGSLPQLVIVRGCWFAAEVKEKHSFSLAGCTVAPGFDFDDFQMGGGELAGLFPVHKDLIERFTRH